MKLYWFRDTPNFGDELGPAILRWLGLDVTWASPAQAEMFGLGSIAGRLPPGFRGWVVGTGKMYAGQRLDLSRARVLALRGPLTAEGAGLRRRVVFADLGLLAGAYTAATIGAVERTIPLGTVRHYVDDRPAAGHAIDVGAGVTTVLAEIARCRRIVSSSLHGLIAADALGIPNRWDPHPGVHGDGFKFRDYAASFRAGTIEPGAWRLGDQAEVADKRSALFAVLADLREAVAA